MTGYGAGRDGFGIVGRMITSASAPIAYCVVCGESLPPKRRTGPAARYCSGRCRTEAYRTRLAQSIQPGVGSSSPPAGLYVGAELIEAADALLAAAADAPPEDRLARALIEARTLAHQLARLEVELPPNLAWRSAECGRRLVDVVADLFPIDEVASA